jgi:hypothetical protein
MIERKARLTVTVDRALVRAGSAAVAAGRAESLSAWINAALAERVAKEKRLRAMAEAVAMYEAAHGAITPEEMVAQERTDKRAALKRRRVRRPKPGRTRTSRT